MFHANTILCHVLWGARAVILVLVVNISYEEDLLPHGEDPTFVSLKYWNVLHSRLFIHHLALFYFCWQPLDTVHCRLKLKKENTTKNKCYRDVFVMRTKRVIIRYQGCRKGIELLTFCPYFWSCLHLYLWMCSLIDFV